MIDAHGMNIDHLKRWDRIDVINHPGTYGHAECMSGSIIAITEFVETDIYKVAVLLDVVGLVEVRSDQIVEDDEAAYPDVQAIYDEAMAKDDELNRRNYL